MRGLLLKRTVLLMILLAVAVVFIIPGAKSNRPSCDDLYILSYQQKDKSFDYKTIADLKKEGVSLTYVRYIYPRISNGFRTEKGEVLATNDNYAYFSGTKIRAGSFFNRKQVDKKLLVAVLNEKAAYQLFGNYECIGEVVILNKTAFTVIGIVKDNKDEELVKIFIPDSVIETLDISGSDVSQLWCSFEDMAEASQVIRKMGYTMDEMKLEKLSNDY